MANKTDRSSPKPRLASARNARPAPKRPAREASARERIDRTAYQLFSKNGVRATGIDRIIAEAGVAKMTLYRHYPTKDKLALAFLRRREELWTRAFLQEEVERRASTAPQRLLAIFDVFDRWFQRPDFEGCSFINVLLEFGEREHPVRAASVRHLQTIRVFLKRLAKEADVKDPEAFARQWHILMKGSIVAAGEGDRDAAQRAQELGALLLANAERGKHTASTRNRTRK